MWIRLRRRRRVRPCHVRISSCCSKASLAPVLGFAAGLLSARWICNASGKILGASNPLAPWPRNRKLPFFFFFFSFSFFRSLHLFSRLDSLAGETSCRPAGQGAHQALLGVHRVSGRGASRRTRYWARNPRRRAADVSSFLSQTTATATDPRAFPAASPRPMSSPASASASSPKPWRLLISRPLLAQALSPRRRKCLAKARNR